MGGRPAPLNPQPHRPAERAPSAGGWAAGRGGWAAGRGDGDGGRQRRRRVVDRAPRGCRGGSRQWPWRRRRPPRRRRVAIPYDTERRPQPQGVRWRPARVADAATAGRVPSPGRPRSGWPPRRPRRTARQLQRNEGGGRPRPFASPPPLSLVRPLPSALPPTPLLRHRQPRTLLGKGVEEGGWEAPAAGLLWPPAPLPAAAAQAVEETRRRAPPPLTMAAPPPFSHPPPPSRRSQRVGCARGCSGRGPPANPSPPPPPTRPREEKEGGALRRAGLCSPPPPLRCS
ncbi:hypothetical protein I4F81_011061 [Pyropia yezoensis]|uniref:Uncharacterized protein n=1 Tax=Pyropia yezoensis TaxID=2788 RepID=A0ACC3CE94_PYRYE|nr:hypothetical protein I4F81_011061 [Neopyropia yezoensis]